MVRSADVVSQPMWCPLSPPPLSLSPSASLCLSLSLSASLSASLSLALALGYATTRCVFLDDGVCVCWGGRACVIGKLVPWIGQVFTIPPP
jgi:hypothetical protein